uniref:Uncharacterized protein n=1 Tax=Nelumbo nucifera TaxID=4432 RepID=A0A822YN65_NELNU|nr:TPA_asm: hypothetical protein HUJ06_012374 [Nelumbo nucifera]
MDERESKDLQQLRNGEIISPTEVNKYISNPPQMANETGRGGFQKTVITGKQRTDLTMNSINWRITNETHREQQLLKNCELRTVNRFKLRTKKQNLEKLKRKP